MNWKNYFIVLLQSLLFWTIAIFIFIALRYYGIEEEISVDSNSQMSLVKIFQLSFLMGPLTGALFSLIEYPFSRSYFKRLPMLVSITVKTGLSIIVLLLLNEFSTVMLRWLFEQQEEMTIQQAMEQKLFWIFLMYVGVCSLILTFIQIANEKFGPGVFMKILLGKYRKPREENRIFMFLDLKSSTTIAERIGHEKYSQLIQDCFFDLNHVISENEAEIYQYVGDEAVLSWSHEKGVREHNCIKVFFDFKSILEEKKEYYLEKYGEVPQFKAGVHGGRLMVAEVGVIKKEIAYHGDTINTAARIQGECNRLHTDILISEDLRNLLVGSRTFISELADQTNLRGRQEAINLYTVKKC